VVTLVPTVTLGAGECPIVNVVDVEVEGQCVHILQFVAAPRTLADKNVSLPEIQLPHDGHRLRASLSLGIIT